MARTIGGILAGIVAMLAVIVAIELAAHLVFPVPSDRDAVPIGVQLLVLAAYFLGALAGGALAARISGRAWTAWAVAIVVVAGAIWSMFMIPHPQWMQIAAVVAPLVGGVVAGHFGRGRASAPAEPA